MDKVGEASEVFSYKKTYKHGKQCCNGVRWKQSTQTFEAHLFSRTAAGRRRALSGRYKPTRYVHFLLNERGKIRPIDAPHINDRQIQKTLSIECLYPLYRPGMIENNAASIKDEGLAYAQKLLKDDLRHHFKRYGTTGWVIVTDMHQFFPSADHEVVKSNHVLIRDATLKQIADSVTDSGGKGKGEPLGVEPSQFEMINLPSPMDNYMTCQVGLSGYGHYMDDFYMLVPPDKDPKEVLAIFRKWTKKLRLTMNEKKTQVLRFGKPFRFCKAKYIIRSTGKVIEKGSVAAIYRCIHKLKVSAPKVAEGLISYEDLRYIVNSSTNGYYDRYDDHSKVLRIRRTFYAIYGFSCEHLEEFRRRDNAIRLREAV